MSENLKKFLIDKRVYNKKNKFNITSLNSSYFSSGKFNINKEDIDEFLKLYNDSLLDTDKKNIHHFLERPISNETPSLLNNINDSNLIKIDIDLKYKKNDLKHTYTENHIEKLLNLYFNTLKKYMNFNENYLETKKKIIYNIKFYVLERKKGYKPDEDKDIVKDGIHIIVPYLLVNNLVLHKVRLDLLKNEDFIKLYKEFNQINSIEDFIDESIISRNAWFLYNSGKKYTDPYLLNNIYRFDKTKDALIKSSSDTLKKINLNKFKLIKSLTHFDAKQKINVNNKEILEELEKTIKISFKDNDKISNFTDNFNNNTKMALIKPKSNVYTNVVLWNFVNNLKTERASNYSTWWGIGQALYNTNYKSFNVWNSFSKKCGDKYNLETNKLKWKEFEDNYKKCKYQLNINYITKLLKEDNNKAYFKINDELKCNILDTFLDVFSTVLYKKKIGDSTFAKNIKKIIESEANYNFVSIQDKCWYYYKNHKWIEDKDANQIHSYLKNEILDKFKKYYNKLVEKIISTSRQTLDNNNSSDEEQDLEDFNQMDNTQNNSQATENSKDEERMETCKKIITYLECSSNRNNIVKELCNELYDESFYQNLDQNPFILHFKNGVLDLNTFNFREGLPDDRITISTNICYITNKERENVEDHKKYEDDYNDFVDTIFPNEEEKDFFLNNIAISLIGKNVHHKFTICSGSGSNGKSIFFNLVEKAYGEYFKIVKSKMFSQLQKDADNASPSIVRIAKARLVVASEIESGASLNTAEIKSLTGGEKITCRALFKDQMEFLPQFNIFLVCNDDPRIGEFDDGTVRRLAKIEFISKFCEKSDVRLKDTKKYKHHFEKDFSLDDKLICFAPIFMNELVNRLKILTLSENKYIINTPKSIQESLDKFFNSRCIFLSFKNDRLIKAPGKKLNVDEAFMNFRNYTDEHNQKYKRDKNTFEAELVRVLGEKVYGQKSNKSNKSNKYWMNWDIQELINTQEEE